jgi:ketosteroid isomerase-like protein
MTTPVDTVRRLYDALGRGDAPSVLSLLDAQVEWTEAERFPYHASLRLCGAAVVDRQERREDVDGGLLVPCCLVIAAIRPSCSHLR